MERWSQFCEEQTVMEHWSQFCEEQTVMEHWSQFCEEQTVIKYFVCFLLGNSPASEFYMPTFRKTLSVPSS